MEKASGGFALPPHTEVLMDEARKRPSQNRPHDMPDHPEPTVIQSISTEHLDSLSDSFNQTLGEVLGYFPNHIDHHKPLSQFQISETWVLQVISYFGQKCRVDLLEDGPG